jgi:hypothetical protein
VAAGQVAGSLPQPAQVDDPSNPRGSGRRGEVLGARAIARGEIAIRSPSHRVDQVVGDVDAPQRRPERVRLEHVRFADLATQSLQLGAGLGMAGQRSHLEPPSTQVRAEPAADVAG